MIGTFQEAHIFERLHEALKREIGPKLKFAIAIALDSAVAVCDSTEPRQLQENELTLRLDLRALAEELRKEGF